MAARRTLDFWLCKRKQIPSFRSPISKGVCFVNFVDYSSKGSRKNSQKIVQYIPTKVRSFAFLSILILLKISSNMDKWSFMSKSIIQKVKKKNQYVRMPEEVLSPYLTTVIRMLYNERFLLALYPSLARRQGGMFDSGNCMVGWQKLAHDSAKFLDPHACHHNLAIFCVHVKFSAKKREPTSLSLSDLDWSRAQLPLLLFQNVVTIWIE